MPLALGWMAAREHGQKFEGLTVYSYQRRKAGRENAWLALAYFSFKFVVGLRL